MNKIKQTILSNGVVDSLSGKKGILAAMAISVIMSASVIYASKQMNDPANISAHEKELYTSALIAKATLESPDFYSSGNALSVSRGEKNYSVKLLYQIGDGETDYPSSVKSIDFVDNVYETRSTRLLGDNGNEIQTIRLYEITETNGGEKRKTYHLARSKINDDALIMHTEIPLFQNGSLDVAVFTELVNQLAYHEAKRAGAIQRMRDVVYKGDSPEALSANEISKSFAGHLQNQTQFTKHKLAINIASGETYISVNYPEDGLVQQYKHILQEHRKSNNVNKI
jgi:hypothetical protein